MKIGTKTAAMGPKTIYPATDDNINKSIEKTNNLVSVINFH